MAASSASCPWAALACGCCAALPLTAALCFVLAALMAALVSLSEDDLKRDIADYKAVPVRKIDRRSDRRHSA